MDLGKKIEKMTNEELKGIWESFAYQRWNSKDMYDKDTSMDEWGMMIYNEMDVRGIKKIFITE